MHAGLALYTVGQRRGLKIGGLTLPLEVVEKDSMNNRLIVSNKGSERVHVIALTDVHFVSWVPEQGVPAPFECQVRSLSARKSGTLLLASDRALFRFDTATSPLSPGQSLVLYHGDEVVGGGVMELA
jgi:tRNA-uridine 2-sulfurtransferase